MNDLKVTCNRCEMAVGHVCHPEIKTLLLKLFTFRPECPPSDKLLAALKASPYYAEGDENAPFFSEAFLYCLLGKLDARTVRAYLHSLMTSMGFAYLGIREDLVKLSRARDLIDTNQAKLSDLRRQIRKASDEEKDSLREQLVPLMEEMRPAQLLVDSLDRWEKPEEDSRFTFLMAISRVTSDDILMSKLKDVDPEVLESKLHAFLKDLSREAIFVSKS